MNLMMKMTIGIFPGCEAKKEALKDPLTALYSDALNYFIGPRSTPQKEVGVDYNNYRNRRLVAPMAYDCKCQKAARR